MSAAASSRSRPAATQPTLSATSRSVGRATKGRTGVGASMTSSRRHVKRVRGGPKEAPMKPSVYIRRAGLSTAEYLAQTSVVHAPQIIEFMDVGEFSNYKDTGLELDQAMFQPFPSEVRFQQFQPMETYEVPLVLRNVDSVGRRVKVLPSNSHFFTVVPPKAPGSKIAPGCEAVYTIRFSPEELRDYSEEIVCVTEREKFVVQIKAVGARALVDFPDELSFGDTTVKAAASRTVLVRNVGNRDANFSLTTEYPFSVDQSHATLGAGKAMQLQFSMEARAVGSFEGAVQCRYDSGECVHVALRGQSQEANVRLERGSVRFENTFIGMSCQRTLRIQNRSDEPVRFAWKQAASEADEVEQRLRATQELHVEEDTEGDEFTALLKQDPTMGHHMSVLSRKFDYRRKQIEADPMLFRDEMYVVTPTQGEVWPNAECEVTVIFKPSTDGEHRRTLFCEVTGREHRLPLKVKGVGAGPRAAFNFDALDIGSIFLGSEHVYEAVLSNLGDIDAPFRFCPTEGSLFGSCFSFHPSEGVVPVDGHQAIQMKFASPRLGAIDEDFVFQVVGAPDNLVVSVSGQVVGPTFHADVVEVDYGVVPFGFVTSRFVTLTNTSSISMDFALRLPDDCPVRHEFEIDPAQGTIPPGGEVQVQVDLTPTFTDRCDVTLLVDVAGVGEGLLSIPVLAECVVPEVSLETPLLEYGRCHLGHPSVATVELRNPSALPAKFTMIPPPTSANPAATFTTDPMVGVVAPNAITTVPLTVVPRALGNLKAVCAFSIAGCPADPLKVSVGLVGEGPEVVVSARKLDWKVLQVLKDQPKTVTLRNESPIPAAFSLRLAKPTKCFAPSPAAGTLAAGEACEVLVHTRLDDTVRFANELLVEVADGATRTVQLAAVGMGSTISCEEDFSSTRFGHQFSDRECERKYVLTNSGRRTQTIAFRLDAPPPNVAGKCTVMRGASFKKKRTPACPNPPDPSRSVFGVWPETATLAPGDSVEVALRGLSKATGRVEETILLTGSFKGHKEVAVLHRMKASAHFGTPIIDVSPESLSFHAAKNPAAVLERESKWVSMKNVSSLQLTAAIAVHGPFRLGDGVPSAAVVPPQSELHLEVVYDPSHRHDSVTRVDKGRVAITYAEHAQVDSVELSAEVYYPNLDLGAREVDFGAILSDTSATRALSMRNTSPMAVEYAWTFVSDAGTGEIAQAFDVCPTRGTLQPGEACNALFSFFGHGACSCEVIAECVAKDGPRYAIRLSGSAGAEGYRISPDALDFFNVDHAEDRQHSLAVLNSGAVPLPVALLSESARLAIEPCEATVAPGGRLDLSVAMLPGVPEAFEEKIRLQVGRGAPVDIDVRGSRVFPHVLLDAPRASTESVAEALAEARRALGEADAASDAKLHAEVDRLAVARDTAAGAKRCKLAPYVLDLGAVVCGQTTSASVAVTNDSLAPVSLALARHGLAQASDKGFSIGPDKVFDLPAGEASSLKVRFAPVGSLRRAYPLGDVSHTFRLDLTGGPQLPLIVTAKVCVPSVDMSCVDGAIDFGRVALGECRVVTVRFTNNQAVACTWSASREKGRVDKGLSQKQLAARRQELKAASAFSVFPIAGHLLPGAHQDVEVTFTPPDDTPCSTTLPVAFEQNPAGASIACAGRGVDADLTVSESLLEFGPLMPRGTPALREVTVANNGDEAVEIFAVEFDERCREEENLLRRLEEHFTEGRMLLPPRVAGQPLPRELYEADNYAYVLPVVSEDGQSEVLQLGVPSIVTSAPLPGVQEVDTPAPTPLPEPYGGADGRPSVASASPSPAELALQRHRGHDLRDARRKHDHGGVNIILSGARAAGKSTLAARLAATYHCLVFNVDAVVERAVADGTVAGRQLQQALQQQAAAAAGNQGATPAAEPSKPGAEPAASPDDAVTAPAPVPADVLAAVLSERFGRPDARAGVVVDGLQSGYGAPAAVADAVLQALSRREHLFFAALRLDDAACLARLRADTEAKERARLEAEAAAAALAPPPAMDEDVYEALPAAEREAYDQEWLAYRREARARKRAAEAAAEAQRQADEEQARLEEEASRKRGGGRRTAVPHKKPEAGGEAGPSPEALREAALAAELGSYDAGPAEELVRFWDRASAGPTPAYTALQRRLREASSRPVSTKKRPPKSPAPPGTSAGGPLGEDTGPADAGELPRPAACVPVLHLDAAEAAEQVQASLVAAGGHLFPSVDQVEVNLGLRAPPDTLPAPEDYCVLRLPGDRPPLSEPQGFSFVDPAAVRRHEAELAALATAKAAVEELAPKATGRRRSNSVSRSRPGSSKPPKKGKESKPGSRRGKRGEEEPESEAKPPPLDDRLRVPRWVVPAGASVTIPIRFAAKGPGVFDQTFTFEAVKSGRQFQVLARAHCQYPCISTAPRDLFPGLLTTKAARHGCYNTTSNTMQFGPLLSGKPKDNIKAIPHPENSMPIMLRNPTGADVAIKAAMEGDETFSTFTLEPRQATIPAGGTLELRVWAYPKGSQSVDDKVIVCVQDNPVPLVINTTVEGVEVGLEFEKAKGSHTSLAFERTLIHRSDTKMLTMHNRKKLPMAWSLTGLEQLGEEVTAVATSGVINPLSTYHLPLHFCSTRPTTLKKIVRVEVSDADNQFSVMQTENVTVTAEAYDVALDVSFPKNGPDGELHFDVLRVFDEKTLQCTLRNKGRYDIGYRFFVNQEAVDREAPDLPEDAFVITPSSGTLHPGDKNAVVKVTFRTRKQRSIRSLPLLTCEVVEPFMKETVAQIPISVSAEAVFSQYALLPARGVNFGCVRHGSAKQTREITIQNTGKTDFKFHVAKLSDADPSPSGGPTGKAQRRNSGLGATTPSGRRSAVPAEKVTSQRFTAGCFTVYPAGGTIPKGGAAKVTVEADAQTEGRSEVLLLVDVDQRNPRQHPNGLRYALSMEACVPAVDARPETLFEDYRVVRRLDALDDVRAPTFSVADNTLSLGPGVVGTASRYRVKLFNSSKVACEVALTGVCNEAPPAQQSKKNPLPDALTFEPAALSIPSREHRYATVVFTPSAIQGYSGSLEASVQGAPDAAPVKFALVGQGVLPRVSVLQPASRSTAGIPLLRFRRTLCGQAQTAAVLVRNDGPVEALVTLEAGQGSRRPDTSAGAGTARASASRASSGTRPVSSRGRRDSMSRQSRRPSSRGAGKKEKEKEKEAGAGAAGEVAAAAPVALRKATDGPFTLVDGAVAHKLAPGETREFGATFAPEASDVYTSQLMLTVQGNEFEAVFIEAKGEGFVADVTVDALADDVLDFGDVPVGEERTVALALSSHCGEVTRFSFPEDLAGVAFSPRQGHLAPGQSRNVRATFSSAAPVSLADESCTLQVARVSLAAGEAAEWTSDQEIVQWMVQEDASGRLQRVQDVQRAPEPQHSEHEGSRKDIVIPCNGFSAWATYSHAAQPLIFPETLALQHTALAVPLTNTGSVRFAYRWTLEDDSMVGASDELPFVVEPASGVLQAGATQQTSVRFAPTRAGTFDAVLRCQVDGQSPDADAAPAVDVSGVSAQPLVHLELPESDYVASGRRDPSMPTPAGGGGGLSADVRVLEFSSCGVSVVNSISFDIVNPTDDGYEYTWRPVQPVAGSRAGGVLEAGPFRCRSASGSCPAGEASRQTFEFVASDLALHEGFWQLCIPRLELTVDLLLVGHSEEPRVVLDRPALELVPLPLGQAAKETVTLINEEDRPFAFKFDATSLAAINRGAAVAVTPSTGTVGPGGRLALTLSFSPQLEQLYSFRLPCRVKNRPSPVVLSVTAEGYDTHAALQNPGGVDHPAQELSSSGTLPLRFGDVHIKERSDRSLVLRNTGKYPYAYSWKVTGGGAESVALSPMTGIVSQGASATVAVSFAPTATGSLEDLSAVCHVKHGPVFKVALEGRGKVPAVALSSSAISFGKVFVHQAGMPVQQETLRITNNDRHQVSLACLFKSTPTLKVDCPATVVKSGQTVDVTIAFTPRAAERLAETLVFEVNSLIRMKVKVTGAGTPCRLQLEQSAQQAVSFGAVQIGAVVTRTVNLVNRSALPVTLSLAADEVALKASAVGIHPGSVTTMQPKQVLPIRLKFAPAKRTPSFVHEVSVEFLGQVERLLTVSGSCQGVDVELDYNQLTFGGVVVDGRASRRVLLTNLGDVGAKFKWDTRKLAPWFTISPAEGYISPGLEVPFSVTFHPRKEQQDVRCEGVLCRVDGVKRPLVLDLAGVAIARQAEKDAVHFHCKVRQAETKSIRITNPTAQTWNLAPVVENDCFSGPPRVTVSPESSATYRITYSPKSMTSATTRPKADDQGRYAGLHNGSVFVPLPDGKALLYHLVGTADKPATIEHPVVEVPCKTSFAEQLPVTNWLKRSQRFRVSINRIKADASTVLKGYDYIDVPGGETRSFALQYYAYKEGTTVAEVVFRNEATKEFVSYEVTFKAQAADAVESLALSTVARQAVTATVRLENPLPQAVTFSQSCTLQEGSGRQACTEIHGPSSFRVPPRAKQFHYTFEYLPLLAREAPARLTLSSSELGTFQYNLALSASPAAPRPTERFSAQLGGQLTKRYRFTNFCTTRCEYSVKIEGSGDFSAPATVVAAAAVKSGTEVALDVSFVPSKLGDGKATMIISSPAGGEHVCPLFGQCSAPTPQGPFVVTSKSGKAGIPFKNVFATTEAFSYKVDNPAFIVKASDTYKSGETKEIALRFDAKDGAARKGKLSVTCNAGVGAGVEWVFYLSGQ